MTRDEMIAEWGDAAYNARENYTVDPHEHIERLITLGDALAALSTPAPVASRESSLEARLRDVAGTVVMICESGDTNMAQLACTETSPLVGECRSILAALSGAEPRTASEAAIAPSATPVAAPPADLVAIVREIRSASADIEAAGVADLVGVRRAMVRWDAATAALHAFPLPDEVPDGKD